MTHVRRGALRRVANVLVANRGEIALRVIRACRELGLRSIAVVSDPDRDAPYAAAADAVEPIGGAAPADSYLRPDKILEAARRSGADAVHPGYGFLSEDAAFAQRCRRAGLVFVGPPPRAMRVLGDKVRARRLAARVGVPTVPGTPGAADVAAARALARRCGYPLIVKAAAGGGGRGMRVVRSAARLERAFREAAAEARAAFGDGTLFVERYIERPRHVEIQLLGDRTGRVMHLFERECSVQRRHQKLIEETPARLDEPTRQALAEAACRLARAAGYQNAGTAEFLLAPDGRFYFLEVNARLQVEHPVTEMTTGIDLVQQQLRLAAGEPLAFDQADVAPRGHAIECRVVAEDPYDGFLPAAGRIEAVRLPAGPGVRVDAALAPGLGVPPFYDSLLAKVVCWGEDRPAALARMRRALGEMMIAGVPTSAPFLRRVLSSADFRRGAVDTGWVERRWNERPPASAVVRAAVLAAVLARQSADGAPRPAPAFTAWQTAWSDEPDH
jgi:acetyl-CoA carboxylase biotin carboxylase subunit